MLEIWRDIRRKDLMRLAAEESGRRGVVGEEAIAEADDAAQPGGAKSNAGWWYK
jgi:hypothetical protein